jgi:hypothetical protein
MTIWHMRIACWIPKARNTHSGCVILIVFPLQQWLHKRASVLRYTYIVCLVSCDKLGLVAVGVVICHGSITWGRWWFQQTSSCSFLTIYSKRVTLLHPFVSVFLSSRPQYSMSNQYRTGKYVWFQVSFALQMNSALLCVIKRRIVVIRCLGWKSV